MESKVVRKEQQVGDSLKEIIRGLKANVDFKAGYTLHHDLLLYNSKLVLPQKSVWIPRVLFELHDSAIGGHSGFFRTFKRVS